MADHDTERKIPTILIIVGIVLYAIGAFIKHGTTSVVSTIVVADIAALVETVLLIIAAFMTAAILKIGFGDLKSASLKFAGITLFTGGLGYIIPFAGGIVGSLVFIGLVMWLFELEFLYAFALAVINFLLTIGIFIAAAVVMANV